MGHGIAIATIFLLGIAAQWLAWRVRLPSILLLLLFGFAAGPDRLGLIDPAALFGDLLLPVVSLAAALILFEGGLTLQLREFREHGRIVGRLCTVGLLVTWTGASLAAHLLVGLPAGIAILLGAILTVSGPTVVVPLLRHIRPRGATGTILKWEGIVIDPIGAVLALLVFEILAAATLRSGAGHAAAALALTVVAGVGLGLVSAWILNQLLRHYWLPDYLHNPAALALVIGAFAASNAVVEDSGLLAVTIMGLVIANRSSVSVRHIVEFKENLRVLLISGVFIVLAANLRNAQLGELDLSAVGFVLALILVVRPLSVFASTWGSSLTWRERVFLAWVFPRGIVAAAVASVFALALSEAGIAGAEVLEPLVFLVIIGTVLVCGLTAAPLAKRLGLATPNPQGVLMIGAHAWAREMAKVLQEEGIPVRLVDTNRRNIAAARLDGLPVWFGSALAEHAVEEIDFSDLGRLFALTPNEEVNTLIGLHYLHQFGRERLYQLGSDRPEGTRTDAVPTELRARLLFGEDVTWRSIAERHARGATLKATTITEQFTLDDFRERHGATALPLFVTSRGRLTVGTVDKPLQPEPGQRLIAWVDEAADD